MRELVPSISGKRAVFLSGVAFTVGCALLFFRPLEVGLTVITSVVKWASMKEGGMRRSKGHL